MENKINQEQNTSNPLKIFWSSNKNLFRNNSLNILITYVIQLVSVSILFTVFILFFLKNTLESVGSKAINDLTNSVTLSNTFTDIKSQLIKLAIGIFLFFVFIILVQGYFNGVLNKIILDGVNKTKSSLKEVFSFILSRFYLIMKVVSRLTLYVFIFLAIEATLLIFAGKIINANPQSQSLTPVILYIIDFLLMLIFLIASYHYAPVVYSLVDKDSPIKAGENIKYAKKLFKINHKIYWRYFFFNIILVIASAFILLSVSKIFGSPIKTVVFTPNQDYCYFTCQNVTASQSTINTMGSFSSYFVSSLISIIIISAPYAYIYIQSKIKMSESRPTVVQSKIPEESTVLNN